MSKQLSPGQDSWHKDTGAVKAQKRRWHDSDDDEEDERSVIVFTQESPLPKTITVSKKPHIIESKILGTANPRKPRVGPEYQAQLPPLPTPKQPESKQP